MAPKFRLGLLAVVSLLATAADADAQLTVKQAEALSQQTGRPLLVVCGRRT